MHTLTLIVRVAEEELAAALEQGFKGAWGDVMSPKIPNVGEFFTIDPSVPELTVKRVVLAEPSSEEERTVIYFTESIAVIENLISSSLAGTSEVWWVAEEP